MNISSSKSPYLLQIERSSRPKATFGNRFRVAIDEEEAKQTTETAEEEEATKEYREEDPNESYALPPEEEPREEYCDNIKDAESDYFLEKYGEKFNDSDLSKLLDELAEKNIISKDDADAASRKCKLSVIEHLRYKPTYREWQNELAAVERVQNVLSQIFGEVTL